MANQLAVIVRFTTFITGRYKVIYQFCLIKYVHKNNCFVPFHLKDNLVFALLFSFGYLMLTGHMGQQKVIDDQIHLDFSTQKATNTCNPL